MSLERSGIMPWRGKGLTLTVCRWQPTILWGNNWECQNLMRILAMYEKASSQAINRQKTTLFFSPNTKQPVQLSIQNVLGAQVMTSCEKYLGLPMVGGKSKVSTFRELQERVTKKVMRWKEKKYFQRREGGPNQDGSTSYSNILHENVQNPKKGLWWHFFGSSKILVGPNLRWEKNSLDQME